MTVRVTAKQTFSMSKADMASYIQDVLYHDPLYKRISEGNNGAYFSAVVRPGMPLVLSTDMTITLDEAEGQTVVRVGTTSQPLIFGDIFGMYNGYITGFLNKLEKAIETERHENMAVDQLRFVR